ncbi:HD domain-containing protein [Patescibacteria group bacterium]
MDTKYLHIWELAKPYLAQGKRKDFVLHTQGVIQGMEILLREEGGDETILLPAAILHDTGWSKVPVKLQRSDDKEDKHKALKLHIQYALPIITEVLEKAEYIDNKIKQVVDIVKDHQFVDPKELSKRLLIDADAMSDVFREQFYGDVKAYNTTPQKLYEFRKKNTFYTKTAEKVFNEELEKRRQEI